MMDYASVRIEWPLENPVNTRSRRHSVVSVAPQVESTRRRSLVREPGR
jgi:hypothetical protein